jgi:UDP-N-acetylglucosamine 1-carboxyvinyltransferase
MITNSYYSSQFFFVQEIAKMKARTVMADPHRIITFGPTSWKSADMLCGDIIQSSYGMLMACLAAPGTSTLNAITPLFRRFPNFVDEFTKL